MKLFFYFFLFFISFHSLGQSTNSTTRISKIEEFILDKKIDSAKLYLKNVSENKYTKILKSITNNEDINYDDQYLFFSNVSDNQSIRFEKVADYINERLKEPVDHKKIDLVYVLIKWTLVSKLRDEVGLEKASEEQKKLEDYIDKFDPADKDVQRAKIRATTHPIVMYVIQKDVKNGKKLCLEGLEKARKLNDKILQMVFLYHLSDFLLFEGNLQGYIDVSEEGLALGKDLPKKSSYYFATIGHLIDAYIYKGDNNDRVLELIDILNNNSSSVILSYALYAKLVSRLDKNDQVYNDVLTKFQAENVPELISKLEVLGKDLNPHDVFTLLNEGAIALEKHGFYKEAIANKDKAIEVTQKIYSQDLSQTLADYKTAQAVKEKEKEIKYEKEKTLLYGVIAALAIMVLLITLMVLRKIQKQSKELSIKNIIIEETLKEKELLVREVHHRVKNNFQIVSSLLELQSKGIEDEKALELANQGKNRVKSMALIHQKLYQNDSGLVDFDEYILLLVNELSSLYKSENKIETKIASKNMKFDVDTAIPLGLIINEIITNSYKYAFNIHKENKLSISIDKEDNENFKLIIEDNGPGLAADFEIKKAKSLGLRLVNRLVKQLHGNLSLSNKNGARFEILFKDIHARQLVD